MGNSLISVVIPVYNVENYLRECLDSVVNQNYRNLQIILVDDGSTDDSPYICDEYSSKDKRIEVYHKKNGGLSDARNYGMDMAKGEWLMFVDSDDYILPETCSRLMEMALLSDAEMAVCDVSKFVDGQKPEEKEMSGISLEFDTKQGIKEYFYRRIPGYANGKLIKRKALNGIRFPSGKLFEDAFVVYKIIGKCRKIVVTQDNLYCYRQRSGSIVNSIFTKRQMDILEANEQAVQYYKNSDKEILKAVYSRQFVSAVDVMRKMPFHWSGKHDKKYICSIIKRTRKGVLKDRNNSSVVRMMAAVSCISPSLLKPLAKMRTIIKIKRV